MEAKRLKQAIRWCNPAFFQYFLVLFKSSIKVTFHIKQDLWLNVPIHNFFLASYKQSKLCNGMCGLPLTINGINKSPIYLSWRVVLSLSTSFSLQCATFKLSCPIILINSVYLTAVITEKSPCNFSRLLVLKFGSWPQWCSAPLLLKVTGMILFKVQDRFKHFDYTTGSSKDDTACCFFPPKSVKLREIIAK